ncbi:MAG: hypothetical protein O3C67_01775 [Cyanobacteria bacterium]|nr:hypothetical protein [Cyanobacteriota bacterium]MDA0867062.1 hypothetical protein [Cyanobacteriota bacterium]
MSAPQYKNNGFPLWKYLTQPVFSQSYVTRLNPWKFWRVYRIQYLERCLEKECQPGEYFNS